MNPTSHALQVAARVWLPEKGCQHLHTSGISDAEAHALIEHFAGQTPPLSDERTSWEPHSWRTYPTVYVIPQRRPDPNSPHRNVTNLWILLDPRRRLSDANVRRIAETSVTPNADSNFDSVIRDWIDVAISSPPSDSQSSSSPSTTPSTPAQSNPSPRRATSLGSLRWFLALVAIVFLIVFLIVVGYKIYPVSQPNSSSGDSSVGESQGTESQEGTTELWQPERVRVKLIDQMKGSLGLHRPELNISKLHDAEILERFVSLFYVDRDELGLTPTETEQMKIRGKNPLTHPMIEFLNQFKSPPQEVKINKDESRGKQCVTSMIRLQDSFIELLEDDFIELLDPDFIKLLEDDDFQHHTPHEVVQLFRFQLDYEKFYHRWYVKYDQSGPEKPYLDDEGKGLTDSWVVKVRKYLKKRFRAS